MPWNPRRQARRDHIARRLYRFLSQARPRLQCLVKDEIVCRRLEKLGPTRRRPWMLCRQASEVVDLLRLRLQDDETASATQVIEEIGATLGELLSELDKTLDQIGLGRYEVASAMLDQRKAMQRFDHATTRGAQLLEAQLILVGLPTLGDAVRPRVGRRGRPLKQRPVDRHPDLVEQVRAVGMIRLDDLEPASTSATEAAIIDGVEHDVSSSLKHSGRSTNVGVQESSTSRSLALSERAEGASSGRLASEKIEHLLTELAQGLEIIEQDLTKPLNPLEIIENPFPKPQMGNEKIGHSLPKPADCPINSMFSRFRALPPAASKDRRRYCRPSVTAGRPRGAASPRARASTPPPSPLGRMRRVASSWWGKLKPAA